METRIALANKLMCVAGLRPCFRLEGDLVISGTLWWTLTEFDPAEAVAAARGAAFEIIEGRLLSPTPKMPAIARQTYDTYFRRRRRRSRIRDHNTQPNIV